MVQRRYIMKLYIIHKRPTELTVKQNKKKKLQKKDLGLRLVLAEQ